MRSKVKGAGLCVVRRMDTEGLEDYNLDNLITTVLTEAKSGKQAIQYILSTTTKDTAMTAYAIRRALESRLDLVNLFCKKHQISMT